MLCLLALYAYAQSQPSIEFYRQYIPSLYLDSAQYRSTIAANIENSETTDPELIYDFLLCFNTETQTFNVIQYQNYLKEISIKKENRKRWALSEIQRLYSSNLEYSLKEMGGSFYQGLVYFKSGNQKYEASQNYDINKRDFFVYRYYTNDSLIQYNLNVNYSDKRNQYESEVVDKYRNYCDQFTTDPDTTKCGLLVKEIPKLWYVFEKQSTIDSSSFSPSELVKLYVTHKYSFEEDFPTYGFGLLFNQNNSSQIDLSLLDNPVIPIHIRIPINLNEYGVSGLYRLQFKKVKSFMSYLEFEVSYFVNNSAHTYRPLFDQNQGYPINDSVYTEYYVTSQHSSLTLSSLSSFYFSISIPLLYINKYILIEPSIGLGINSISYTYDYSYNYRQQEIRKYYNSPTDQTVIINTGISNGSKRENSYIKYTGLASMNISFNLYKNIYIQGNFGINNTSIAIQDHF
jgi:hypothetical protein